VCIVLQQSKRTFVEKVDFITSAGQVFAKEPGVRYRRRTVITDLCMMENDRDTGELILTCVHPGVAVEKVLAETGWKPRIAEGLRETPAPMAEELAALRDLKKRTAAAQSARSTWEGSHATSQKV
jgi:glutaconate CoA-transferase subunit B